MKKIFKTILLYILILIYFMHVGLILPLIFNGLNLIAIYFGYQWFFGFVLQIETVVFVIYLFIKLFFKKLEIEKNG
jgi:hypothetical protein